MRSRRTGGIALIAVILLVIIASIVIMGIASLLSNSIYSGSVEIMRAQALAAAQAGVFAAIQDYTAGSLWNKAETQVSGNIWYAVGGRASIRQADFLLVDADNPDVVDDSGTDNQLQRVPLSNVNSTDPNSINVNQMKVDWNFGGTLTRVRLGDDNHDGIWSTGETFAISSPVLTIDAGDSYDGNNDNYWRFSNTIPSDAIIVVTFYFSDGSSRKAMLYNGVLGCNNEFLITSTGEVRSIITWKRTIEATYDVGTTEITSWQETENHL